MKKTFGLIVVLAIAMWLLWTTSRMKQGTEPPAPDAPAVQAAVPAAAAMPHAPTAQKQEDKSVPSEKPIADFRPEPGADDPGPGPYIQRYEGRSGRLSPNAKPESTDPTTKLTSTGPAPHLTVWVPVIRIQAGADVMIHAQLVDDDGQPVAPDAIAARIGLHGSALGPPQPLARDLTLRFPAPRPTVSAAPAAYDYLVEASGTFHGESFTRSAGGSFFVHDLGAIADAANARVERRANDLVLSLPARISRAGTYWMYAELWGGPEGAVPIAFGRERFEHLPAGARTLSIFFGGAVIRDSGLDGPYVVRNLRFQQVDAFPPQEQEPVGRVLSTQAFRASEFN